MQRLLLLIIFCIPTLILSQELPPILNYSTEDYSADNQNWMISQNKDGFIYAANNGGLLEFDGERWAKYDSPNSTIMRSVNVIHAKIYTGCFAEFGYWEKTNLGTLAYTSLASKLNNPMLEDEQVWNILEYNEWVVFQSNRALYFFNEATQTIKIIPSKNLIYKVFIVNKSIYYHVANEGIYTIVGGEPSLLIPDTQFNSDRIINISSQNNQLLLITRNSGFFHFKDSKLTRWVTPGESAIDTINIFSALQLRDGSLVLGTISNGLLYFDKTGHFLYKITQKSGLGNNTVLSLFEDKDSNLWAGLDNGINSININSPVRSYSDFEGVLGTVYTSIVFKETLYLGTNQGVFYKDLNSKATQFKFLPGTAGQVLSFYNYKNEDLLCGHHLGTFTLNNKKATRIANELGSWDFKPIANRQNILLQGNYNGLYLLKKEAQGWKLISKIQGFNNSSRYFEFVNEQHLLVSHEYKGVFNLKLNDSLTAVTEQNFIDNVPVGKNSALTSYQNSILYATEKGVYTFSPQTEGFKKDSLLSSIYNDYGYISGKLISDKKDRLWLFSKENISLVSTDNLTNLPRIAQYPIPSFLRKGVLGYENINLIAQDVYLLGVSGGYLTIDISKVEQTHSNKLFINSIQSSDLEGHTQRLSSRIPGVLNFRHGMLTFKYAVPQYKKFIDVNYQYQLKGFQSKWSEWTHNSVVSFENLPFGDYEFLVRAKIGNELSVNTASYTFSVERPWLLSGYMLAVYVLILIVILVITHRTYRRYYSKKLEREQLENQQKIMQIQNEKLNQDIDNKNRELAISTMSIIKKNEVLSKIKKELLKDKDTADPKGAIDLIDSHLNNNKDWKFFKQAFNNADKDFLDKIKKAHPDLTPNDLRFCAYLRLNLTSKEIAPLLNISTKSVETKRYRLRKRLNLDHDDSLVNYILKF
ncbi:triple tyrosine motif-containing protein [Leeuwenhoekiella aequorea]|uniref:helix-turn-helix and ligand-binding sensor domain-containing protein n=1 Tax=Leeuwenhoekiella aequorea TaxID=283736 RepID=UPI00352E42EA|tara:strand:+ start:604 stop:3375 length:2772 start_codon:yes stop_codon:yes gene_type:complete